MIITPLVDAQIRAHLLQHGEPPKRIFLARPDWMEMINENWEEAKKAIGGFRCSDEPYDNFIYKHVSICAEPKEEL